METMSPKDASFLHTEDAVTHLHIGSVGIFEGPAPAPDEVPATLARQLPLVPRYRQKVRFVPLDPGRPISADDPHFNLDYDARRMALPSPGGDPELRNQAGRVMSQQLDRPSRCGRSGSPRDAGLCPPVARTGTSSGRSVASPARARSG
ncbi:MAG: wax ester/triacylglycerol synthase domain-containing protein [Streptosporangiaceae bacterium]